MKQINPNSLQGKDRLDKMRNLMGKMTINENKNSNSKVELSKLGPDNKVYGIVKENHEYFIKTTDKIQNVMTEDFQYIGGLANKKEFAFESYSKALKKLNLKMISLNEQFEGDKVNVFENDNLIVGDDTIDDDADFEDYVEEAVGDKCNCGENTYCNATGEDCSVKDDTDMNEAELNVGTVVTDGPKDLDGNTVGDFKDSDLEPDDAPNDKSTGTEKEGAEKATPKKTIKEAKRKRLSILDALERFDDIVESVIKKKSLTETKYKLKVDDPSPEPEPQGVNSGEASFDEPAPEAAPAPDGGFGEPAPEAAPSEKPFDDEPFDAGVEADEESEPKQFIQQLSGKLGQSLRTYTQDVGLDLELEKFAINSLLSATHTSEMDQEDQQDIIKRVETSGDEPEEEDPLEEPAPEMDGADVTGASNPASAPAPEGGGAPMGESFEVLDKEDKQVFKDAKLGVTESFGESTIDLDGLCEKYKDNSKLVKELRYYEFVCNLKKVEPDAETIEMIISGNKVGDHVDKYADVMENEDSPEDDYMSIEDLERVEREISSSMHSHDMVENDDENDENRLSIKNKKDSFANDAIKRMMDDYLNTQNGFNPETKPQPKIMPETKPAKVPRRSKPFRVNPNPNPTPKGKV